VTSAPSGEPCDCHLQRADGVEDLVLEFDAVSLLALLAPVGNNDVRTLRVDGTRTDATYFRGEDCVRIVGSPIGRRAAIESAKARETLVFNLAEPRTVRISIYDVTGRLVARPVDAMRPAGIQEVNWDRKDLPSGIYFYRIEAGEERQSGRIVHIR